MSLIQISFLLAAIVLYGLSVCMLYQGIFARADIQRQKLAILSFTASILHLAGSLGLIFSSEQPDFNIFASGSMIFAVTSGLIALRSIHRPVHALLLLIQPIAIGLIISSMLFAPSKPTNISSGVAAHILFSVLSYGLITIAAASALVMGYVNHKLKHKKLGNMGSLVPPIETTEKLLFEFILAGEILLSISILTGFIFIENFFGQQLAHKTFFSLLSWLIFAILLTGHHYFGWRGSRAMNWTIAGFITLLLAYVGSKFVLELILT